MTRPRIAVTGNYSDNVHRPRAGVDAGYVLSLRKAGSIPMIVPPLSAGDAGGALEGFDGLLLPGGRDIDPAFYDQSPGPDTDPADRERDLFEMEMFREAESRRIPVLAICRGFQLVNVALGGTLWQDLPTERPGDLLHRPANRAKRVHELRLLPGSRLSSMLDATTLTANSSHHQGIRELASGLASVGESNDGLVEAWEAEDREQWIFGVQWHPELHYDEPESPDFALFKQFVRAAGAGISVRVS